MSVITKIPLEDCVGLGTGVSDDKLIQKQKILQAAVDNYSGSQELEEKLAYFGGFEIIQMASGMLAAHENNMLILVDGFICSVAFLIAHQKNPEIIKNAIFCHCSAEQAHVKLLDYIGVQPVLKLGLRLGEGTGCAIAFPIIQSAMAFLNEMASFDSAEVNNK